MITILLSLNNYRKILYLLLLTQLLVGKHGYNSSNVLKAKPKIFRKD